MLTELYAVERSDWAEWLMNNVSNAEITALSGMKARVNIRFGIPGFVKATIDFIWSRVNPVSVKSSEGDSEGDSDGAQIGSSGDGARINVEGKRSVAASVGHQGRIKGALGTWITLAEWDRDDDGWYPACVRSAKIDGEILKADTWYVLQGREFVAVD